MVEKRYFCEENKVKIMRKGLTLIFLLSLVSVSALAQEVGEYGFLEIPVSTRAAALGGTVVSVVEPESSLADQNPALLCKQMSGQVALSYLNYVSDIDLGYASYTGKFLSEGAWQGAVRYVNYGKFNGYDENGNSTGSFSANDISFSGSVGYPINDHWTIGGTARGIYTSYESYNAFALAVDLGLNYYDEEQGRSISLVATNLGGQLRSLDDRYQHLPTQIACGFTKELAHLPLAITLTGYDLLDWDIDFINHFLIGAEWLISDNLYFAAAYNYRRQHEFSGGGGFLRGLSYGGGFKYRKWSFQLSYARYNSVDGSLSIGLNYQI